LEVEGFDPDSEDIGIIRLIVVPVGQQPFSEPARGERRKGALVRRRFIGVSACVVLLSACAGWAAVNSGRLLQDYVDCNALAANQLALSAGDAVALAIEAEASCEGSRMALEHVYRRSVGPDQAGELIDNIKRVAVANNAAAVLLARGR
jgi:hypothetical protein